MVAMKLWGSQPAAVLGAVIGDPPNQPASVALHLRFGFAEAGRLPAVGWKFDAWRDTLLMQRALGPGAAAPPG
jgi:phosphinothricin acetyltransferase